VYVATKLVHTVAAGLLTVKHTTSSLLSYTKTLLEVYNRGLLYLVIQTVISVRNIVVVKGIVKFAIKRVTVDSSHYLLMKEM